MAISLSAWPLALNCLDFFANRPGFLFGIPACRDLDLRFIGVGRFGKQCLAQSPLIVGNQMRGRLQDMRRGAVIAAPAG